MTVRNHNVLLLFFFKQKTAYEILTGYLQGLGLDAVLSQPGRPVDILQASHHGSRTSNTPALASCAWPRVVVLCVGTTTFAMNMTAMYAELDEQFLRTWLYDSFTF